MHVGVCMKIQAEDLEEAKEIAKDILHKNSMEESNPILQFELPIEEFLSYIPKIELPPDKESQILYLTLQDDKTEVIKSMIGTDYISDMTIEDLCSGDYFDYFMPFTNKIIEIIKEDKYINSLSVNNMYFADELQEAIDYEIIGDNVKVTIQFYVSTGYWDYSYGISESFGVHDSAKLRVNTCHSKDLNPMFLEVLMKDSIEDTERRHIESMIDYYLDEDEGLLNGDIQSLREYFTNVEDDTYFITGSVHV